MEVSEEALLQQQISLFHMTSGLSLSMTRTGRIGPVPPPPSPPNLPHQTSTERTKNKNIFGAGQLKTRRQKKVRCMKDGVAREEPERAHVTDAMREHFEDKCLLSAPS